MPCFVVSLIFSVDGGKTWKPMPSFQIEADTIQTVAGRMARKIDSINERLGIKVRLTQIREGELETRPADEIASIQSAAAGVLYMAFYANLTSA